MQKYTTATEEEPGEKEDTRTGTGTQLYPEIPASTTAINHSTLPRNTRFNHRYQPLEMKKKNKI